MFASLVLRIMVMPLVLWGYFVPKLWNLLRIVLPSRIERILLKSGEDTSVYGNDTKEASMCYETINGVNAGEVLENTLILRKILNELSSRDLLAASEVCTTWYAEARTILRDHRKSVLSIYGERPCVKLLMAAKVLSQNKDKLPFNGFDFDFDLTVPHGNCRERSEDVTKQLECFLHNFPMRHLRVRSICKNSPYRCITANFLQTMIEKNAQVIEEMDFEQCPDWLASRFVDEWDSDESGELGGLWESDGYEDEMDYVKFETLEDADTVGKLYLPALKELKIGVSNAGLYWHSDFHISESRRRRFLREIVNGAPKLERIGRSWDLRNLVVIPRRAWSLVENLEIGNENDDELSTEEQWQLLRFASRVPWKSNLKKLSVESRFADVLLTSGSHLLFSVVTGSYDILTQVKFPYCIVKMLKEAGIPALKNVSYLEVELHEYFMDRMKLPVFPWQKVFPGVKSLAITLTEDWTEYCNCHDEDIIDENVDQGCDTLLTLVLNTDTAPIRSTDFENFTKGFPNLKSFVWRCENPVAIPEFLPHVWSNWLNLNSLNLTLRWGNPTPSSWEHRSQTRMRWTSAITGFSPEETAELLKQSEEYLSKVNAFPSAPSITNLPDIELFAICLWDPDEPLEGDYSLVRTKVCDLLAFNRLKKLRVRIYN